MAEEANFSGLETAFHRFYPTGFVVAIYQGESDAAATADDLTAAGFEDVRHFKPEEMTKHIAEQPNTLVDRIASGFSETKNLSAQYREKMNAGYHFVLVKADKEGDPQRALPLLDKHNGEMIYQYNQFTFMPLE